VILNQAQRREMSRRFKRQGRDVVVLRGGPMDGWIVTSTAPALRPDWRDDYLEGAAETAWRQEHGRDRRPWEALPDEVRDPYRAAARALHGAGHYELKPGEATATWREAVA
jgi:hypothetical protein